MLPKRVRVRNAVYTIELTPAYIDYRGRKCRGVCFYQEKKILLYSKQTKRWLLSTFFHELGHAIGHEYRRRGFSSAQMLPERYVLAIEMGMAEIFLNNPAMRRFARQWKPRAAPRKGSSGSRPAPARKARPSKK